MNHKIRISLGYIANFYLKGKKFIFQLCLKSILNLSPIHRFKKKFFSSSYFYLFNGGEGVHNSESVEVGGQSLSFYHVGPGDRTQTVWLGGRCLNLLSHSTRPAEVCFVLFVYCNR